MRLRGAVAEIVQLRPRLVQLLRMVKFDPRASVSLHLRADHAGKAAACVVDRFVFIDLQDLPGRSPPVLHDRHARMRAGDVVVLRAQLHRSPGCAVEARFLPADGLQRRVVARTVHDVRVQPRAGAAAPVFVRDHNLRRAVGVLHDQLRAQPGLCTPPLAGGQADVARIPTVCQHRAECVRAGNQTVRHVEGAVIDAFAVVAVARNHVPLRRLRAVEVHLGQAHGADVERRALDFILEFKLCPEQRRFRQEGMIFALYEVVRAVVGDARVVSVAALVIADPLRRPVRRADALLPERDSALTDSTFYAPDPHAPVDPLV